MISGGIKVNSLKLANIGNEIWRRSLSLVRTSRILEVSQNLKKNHENH